MSVPTKQPETILMQDWCPFLTCLLPTPHTHEICPDCGAVRYGNLYCRTCYEHRPSELGRMIHEPLGKGVAT